MLEGHLPPARPPCTPPSYAYVYMKYASDIYEDHQQLSSWVYITVPVLNEV
jgi:hypothetical protein